MNYTHLPHACRSNLQQQRVEVLTARGTTFLDRNMSYKGWCIPFSYQGQHFYNKATLTNLEVYVSASSSHPMNFCKHLIGSNLVPFCGHMATIRRVGSWGNWCIHAVPFSSVVSGHGNRVGSSDGSFHNNKAKMQKKCWRGVDDRAASNDVADCSSWERASEANWRASSTRLWWHVFRGNKFFH
jgi:hypothetical protein